jgi:hypothetical protein
MPNTGDPYISFQDRLIETLTRVSTLWVRIMIAKIPGDGFVPTPPPLEYVMALLEAPDIDWDVYRCRSWVRSNAWSIWNDEERRRRTIGLLDHIDVHGNPFGWRPQSDSPAPSEPDPENPVCGPEFEL